MGFHSIEKSDKKPIIYRRWHSSKWWKHGRLVKKTIYIYIDTDKKQQGKKIKNQIKLI